MNEDIVFDFVDDFPEADNDRYLYEHQDEYPDEYYEREPEEVWEEWHDRFDDDGDLFLVP